MLININNLDLTNNVYKDITFPCLMSYDYKVDTNNYTLNVIDKYNLSRRYKNGGSCIAGGSICRQVFKLPRSDIDIFFWGLTPDQVIDLIKIICDELNILYSYRTKHCITIIINDNNEINIIQFILMIYKDEYDIISGFDMDSSCALISYDKNCYVSERGKLAFETRTNIFRPEYRGINYEKRLIKYLELGFYFIVPNMDILKVGEYYQLPKYLNTLKVRLIKNNFMYVSKILTGDSQHSYDIDLNYKDNRLKDINNDDDDSKKYNVRGVYNIIIDGVIDISILRNNLRALNITEYVNTGELKILIHY